MYKNIAFGLTLFYYELYTSFRGENLYDDWYMVMFNVMLTSLPVISLGVFEQDASSDVCLQVTKFDDLHAHTLQFSGHNSQDHDNSIFLLQFYINLQCNSLQPFTDKAKRMYASAGAGSLAGY